MAIKMACPTCGHRWEIQRSNYDYSCPSCTALRRLLAESYQRGRQDAEAILKARTVDHKPMREPVLKLDCPRCGHRWQVTVAESYDRSRLMCPNGCDAPKTDKLLTREEAFALAMGVYQTSKPAQRVTGRG